MSVAATLDDVEHAAPTRVDEALKLEFGNLLRVASGEETKRDVERDDDDGEVIRQD